MAASGGEVKFSSRQARKCAALGKILVKEEAKIRFKKVERIWKKDEEDRTPSESEILQNSQDDVTILEKRAKLRDQKQERDLEVEDAPDVLEDKCVRLAEAISAADRVVIYTGAGISTAASIPDYRGPNGVWTLLKKGKAILPQDLCNAEPTITHMTLVELYRHGYINYIVSQNCDGLHLRSGLPRSKLSEVHGNMFIEMCTACQPHREYIRLFDVTEKTARHRHKTKRQCKKCKGPLRDTIIHFGEKGPLRGPPYNWMKARSAADKADLILCLGSSLKVLRKYQELWAMEKPKPERPLVYIVNLQWTPKDDAAALKINGRCDDVMSRVAKKLGIEVPSYDNAQDPLYYLYTPLTKKEVTSTTQKILTVPANFVAPPRVAHRRKRPLPESRIAFKVSKLEVDQVSGVTLGESDHDYGVKLEAKSEYDTNEVKVKTESESEIYSGDIPSLPDHTYAHRLIEPGLILRDEMTEHSSCLNSLNEGQTVVESKTPEVTTGTETSSGGSVLFVSAPVLVPVVQTSVFSEGGTPAAPLAASSGISMSENSETEGASQHDVMSTDVTAETSELTQDVKTQEVGEATDDVTETLVGENEATSDESQAKTEPAPAEDAPKPAVTERLTPVSRTMTPVSRPTSRTYSSPKVVLPNARPMVPYMSMSNGARVPMAMSGVPHHGGAIMTANGMLMPNPGAIPGMLPGMMAGMHGAGLPGLGQLSASSQYMQSLLAQNGALFQPGLGLSNAHQMAGMSVPMMQRLPLVSSQALPSNVMGPGCHVHTLQYMPQLMSDPGLLQRQMAAMQGHLGQSMQGHLGQSMQGHLGQAMQGQLGQAMQGQLGQAMQGQLGQAMQGHLGQAMQGHLGQAMQGHLGQAMQGHLGQAMQGQLGQAMQGQLGQAMQGQLGQAMQGHLGQAMQGHLGQAMQGHLGQAMQGQLGQSMAHMVNPASAYGQVLGQNAMMSQNAMLGQNAMIGQHAMMSHQNALIGQNALMSQNAVNTILAQQHMQRAAIERTYARTTVGHNHTHAYTTPVVQTSSTTPVVQTSTTTRGEHNTSMTSVPTTSVAAAVTSDGTCDTADLHNNHAHTIQTDTAPGLGDSNTADNKLFTNTAPPGGVNRTRSADSRSSSSPDSARSSDSPSLSVPGWFGKGLRVRKKRQSKS